MAERYKKSKTGADFFSFVEEQRMGKEKPRWLFGDLDIFGEKDLEKNKNFYLKYWVYARGDNPDHKTKTHRISTEYTFVIKGKIEGMVDGEEITLETGDYVVIPPGIPNNLMQKIHENTVGITIKSPSVKFDTDNYHEDFVLKNNLENVL